MIMTKTCYKSLTEMYLLRVYEKDLNELPSNYLPLQILLKLDTAAEDEAMIFQDKQERIKSPPHVLQHPGNDIPTKSYSPTHFNCNYTVSFYLIHGIHAGTEPFHLPASYLQFFLLLKLYLVVPSLP